MELGVDVSQNGRSNLGLQNQSVIPHEVQATRRIWCLIFPTTPQAKKNYWLGGFRLLAATHPKARLAGWSLSERLNMNDLRQVAVPGFLCTAFLT